MIRSIADDPREMIPMKITLLLLTLYLTMFAPPAFARQDLAQDWRETTIEDKQGQFRYCYVEAGYKNKHGLLIALQANGSFNIGVGIPEAKLQTGQSITATLKIDDKAPENVVGQVMTPELFVMEVGQNFDFYRQLMRGYSLSITTSLGLNESYSLQGSSRALSYLIDCIEENIGKDQEAILDKFIEQDALPPALVQILYHAGVKDFQTIDLSKVPADQRMADFAWSFGPALGGLQEGKVEGDLSDFSTYVDQYHQGLEKLCTGRFSIKFSDIQDLEVMKTQRFDGKCDRDTGGVHISGVLYLTQTQVLTLIYHEVPMDYKDFAVELSDNIQTVLIKAIEDGLARREAIPE